MHQCIQLHQLLFVLSSHLREEHNDIMRKRSWENAAVLYEGETDVFGVCATAMEVDVEPALVARLTASLRYIHVACTKKPIEHVRV